MIQSFLKRTSDSFRGSERRRGVAAADRWLHVIDFCEQSDSALSLCGLRIQGLNDSQFPGRVVCAPRQWRRVMRDEGALFTVRWGQPRDPGTTQ